MKRFKKTLRLKSPKLIIGNEPPIRPHFEVGNESAIVGFSLKKTVKKVGTAVKKTAKVAVPSLKTLASAAKVVGPAVSLVYPPAGLAITAAAKITDAATKGDKNALKRISDISNAAGLGDPIAQAKLEVLDIAKTAQKTNIAQNLLKTAKAGSKAAMAKINEIKEAASAGIEEAQESLKTIQNAAKGLDLPPPGQPVSGPVANLGSKLSLPTIAGGAAVLGGIAYMVLRRKKTV
jgi:hypothetical protein